MQNEKKNALIWLRNDLRIKDHCGFYNAARNCDKIFAYFSFEPYKFEDTKWGFKKTEKFLFFEIFFTSVVFPAPEGDESINIPPFLKLDIKFES